MNELIHSYVHSDDITIKGSQLAAFYSDIIIELFNRVCKSRYYSINKKSSI